VSEEIFREVDEELREDNLLRMWRRFGPYVVGVVVTVIVVTASSVGWKEYRASQLQAWGSSFSEAMTLGGQESPASAAAAFAIIAEESGDGYPTLSRLQEAALLARSGDTPAALVIYNDLSETAIDQRFRDLAVILAGYLELDTRDPVELEARLAPLTADNSPWHYSAIELTAFIAVRTGDLQRARDIFTKLSGDAEAPSGVRSRARDMLAIIGD
jgi:hypothetical protein